MSNAKLDASTAVASIIDWLGSNVPVAMADVATQRAPARARICRWHIVVLVSCGGRWRAMVLEAPHSKGGAFSVGGLTTRPVARQPAGGLGPMYPNAAANPAYTQVARP
jgi:hypothetical protein